jgi:hypothetical protein
VADGPVEVAVVSEDLAVVEEAEVAPLVAGKIFI